MSFTVAMKVLLSAVFASLAIVSYAGPGRMHGPLRTYEECGKSSGLSDETATKIKDALKALMADPKKLKEKMETAKVCEEVKAVVKEAEPDKVSLRSPVRGDISLFMAHPPRYTHGILR